MLLRPIHIKSTSDSDIKDESSLSPTGPEAACGTEEQEKGQTPLFTDRNTKIKTPGERVPCH